MIRIKGWNRTILWGIPEVQQTFQPISIICGTRRLGHCWVFWAEVTSRKKKKKTRSHALRELKAVCKQDEENRSKVLSNKAREVLWGKRKLISFVVYVKGFELYCRRTIKLPEYLISRKVTFVIKSFLNYHRSVFWISEIQTFSKCKN